MLDGKVYLQFNSSTDDIVTDYEVIYENSATKKPIYYIQHVFPKIFSIINKLLISAR